MAGLQIKKSDGQNKTEYGKNIVISVLFMTGWIWMYATAFPVIASGWWLLALLGSVICAGLVLLYETRLASYLLVIGLLINILGLGSCFFFFKDGILCLVNDFLGFLTGRTGRIYLDYPVDSENGACFAAFWIFFLMAVWIAKAVKYREKVTIVVLFLVMTLAILGGLVQISWGFVLVIVATALFLFPVAQRSSDEKDRTDRKGKRPGMSVFYRAWNCFGILFAGLLVGLIVYGVNHDFSTEKGIAKVKEAFHQWKYESEDVAMPEGDLSNVNAFKKGDRAVLAVTMEEPQKLYLRGMVGEVYTGTEWKEPEQETYVEAEDTFYWLHKYGFYGQNSIGNAMEKIGNESTYEMTITNIAACGKYQYLSYALVGSQILDEKVIGDGSVLANNVDDEKNSTLSADEKTESTDGDSIKITYIPGSLPEWYQTKTSLVQSQKEENIQEYLKLEQTYREYVQKQNLQINNAVVGVCEKLLKDRQSGETLGEITATIRQVLAERLSYSEQIVTRNGSNDFLQYTMEQSKKGYSVHYATAAVLMLRYCGVPARYVEGYFLSAEEASQYEKGESILLSEAHAHAWAEYYLDGIGWVPFEVTPGYVDEEELLELQSLASGNENSQNTEQIYNKSTLKYQPPLDLMPEDNSKKEEFLSWLTWKHVLVAVGIILLILCIFAVYRILGRRKYLYQILQETGQEDNRGAIAATYGYAGMLRNYANAESESLTKNEAQVKELNQEAIFSNHNMTIEQRRFMEDYLGDVLRICKEQWPVWKRIWYHYVLWLYR